MGKGTQASFVNSNLYIANSELSSETADSRLSPIPDAIRYFGGNFWTADKSTLVKNKVAGLYEIEQINSGTLSLKADKGKFIDENNFVNGILTRVYDQDKWKSFVSSALFSVKNGLFDDLYMNFDTPVSIPEIKHSSPVGGNYINREFVYNFYAPEYENLVGNQFLDVKTLPTVYSVFLDKRADIKTEKENLELSLGGYIQQGYVDTLSLSKDAEKVSNYFQQYAKTYDLPEVRPVINRLKGLNAEVILDDALLAVPESMHRKFIPFPFYSAFEFTNPAHNQDTVIKFLKANGKLQNNLLSFVQNQFAVPETQMISSSPVVNSVAVPTYDFKKWINSNLANYTSEGDSVDSSPKLYTSFSSLLSYIKKHIKPKTREYKDFSDGCTNQILFYKITKHQYKYSSTPLQTWYAIPAETALVQFYDTQIKYATDYYYNISAFTMVVGNTYKYLDTYYTNKQLEHATDIANGVYKVNITNSTTYKIFEIPYARFTGAVHQDPITKPVASFKMLDGNPSIYLEESPLQTHDEFEPVENGEISKFESIRLSQENEKIETIRSTHALEGDYRTLQIYKLLDKPTSYSAYQGKLYKSILLKPNENIIYESLTANKYYYYLFRYVNAHGIPSNVSSVYRVILHDDEGTRYIESEILDLMPEYARSKTKNFKKYLLVRPTALQLLPSNDMNPDTVEDIVLGPNDIKVWNKKFLMRIRSLKSGRILNYTFGVTLDKRK